MIYAKLLAFILIPIMSMYYFTMALHYCGIISITRAKVSFKKAIIPFYYWYINK
jgi:hypothetical protein